MNSAAPAKVAVIGAGGRMGSMACDAIAAAADLQVVARLGREGSAAVAEASRDAGATVALELSVPGAAAAHVAALVDAGIHVVVGTTGWDADALSALSARLETAPRGTGVLIAPNFAIGAVLMMRFAAVAAPFFESVEVVEVHHPAKVDAPSGTAAATAQAIAAARRAAGTPASPDATSTALDGARGSLVDDVPVHSLRLRGLTATQEVWLGSPGEVLTIRHDATDRSSFMPGVLTGLRGVASHPGLTVGLEHYLDLGAV